MPNRHSPVSRRTALRWLAGAAALGAAGRWAFPSARRRQPPHILFIHADDLGWSDLPSYGATLRHTPHLDRLARDGMRFTQAYAGAPICTPSRACLVTGLHCARLNTTGQPGYRHDDTSQRRLLHPPFETTFPIGTPTIAHTLAAAGYRTVLIGENKWGFEDDPRDHGFHESVPGPDADLTEATLRFLSEAAPDQPFFIYLNYFRPHTPLRPDPAHAHAVRQRPGFAASGQNADYVAVVEELDHDVGRVLGALEQRGLAANTVVIFGSDNGGFLGHIDNPITSNAPLREGKASLYEGGIRVPLLVRWPGVVPPGTVQHTPMHWCDWHATLAEIAGTEPQADGPLDGISIAPLFRDHTRVGAPRSLYWHFPHYRRARPGLSASPSSAVRAGDWKLLHFYETDHVELYDLAQDPGETRDLARQDPIRATALRAQLDAWRTEVDAQVPPPNPAFRPPPAASS
jgi:arylsulfatase A